MKKYLVIKKLKKSKAEFFSSVEEGNIIVITPLEDGKFSAYKDEKEVFTLTANKLEKGLANLEVKEVKDKKKQSKTTEKKKSSEVENEDSKETKKKDVSSSKEIVSYVNTHIDSIELDLKHINEELKVAKGKHKRHLKKWKTRVESELRKEILLSKLIH